MLHAIWFRVRKFIRMILAEYVARDGITSDSMI